MRHRLYNGDCLEILKRLPHYDCLFADPPDNIKLGYGGYEDNLPDAKYVRLLEDWLHFFILKAGVVWLTSTPSGRSRWGRSSAGYGTTIRSWKSSLACLYTFGQHNHHDLGNNHRPLWRFRADPNQAPLYPDQIRVPSWRQEHGDKRSHPRGRVPGNLLGFDGVVGNSKQHALTSAPTQRGAGGTVRPHVHLGPQRGRQRIDGLGPFCRHRHDVARV